MRRAILACLALSACGPAHAATRGFTVTSFERIRIEGPYDVTLRTGLAPSARATGPQRALDRLSVAVEGGTLVVRTDASGWGGFSGDGMGKVVVAVTTPTLTAALLAGSGDLAIDKVRGASLDLALAGSGDVTLGTLAAERLSLSVNGSGDATLAGRVAQAKMLLRGSGGIAASGLTVADLEMTALGSGDAALSATRSAKVTAAGSGDVSVAGHPACTVHATGSGDVTCAGKTGSSGEQQP